VRKNGAAIAFGTVAADIEMGGQRGSRSSGWDAMSLPSGCVISALPQPVPIVTFAERADCFN
jgi:hypothetical protein